MPLIADQKTIIKDALKRVMDAEGYPSVYDQRLFLGSLDTELNKDIAFTKGDIESCITRALANYTFSDPVEKFLKGPHGLDLDSEDVSAPGALQNYLQRIGDRNVPLNMRKGEQDLVIDAIIRYAQTTGVQGSELWNINDGEWSGLRDQLKERPFKEVDVHYCIQQADCRGLSKENLLGENGLALRERTFDLQKNSRSFETHLRSRCLMTEAQIDAVIHALIRYGQTINGAAFPDAASWEDDAKNKRWKTIRERLRKVPFTQKAIYDAFNDPLLQDRVPKGYTTEGIIGALLLDRDLSSGGPAFGEHLKQQGRMSPAQANVIIQELIRLSQESGIRDAVQWDVDNLPPVGANDPWHSLRASLIEQAYTQDGIYKALSKLSDVELPGGLIPKKAIELLGIQSRNYEGGGKLTAKLTGIHNRFKQEGAQRLVELLQNLLLKNLDPGIDPTQFPRDFKKEPWQGIIQKLTGEPITGREIERVLGDLRIQLQAPPYENIVLKDHLGSNFNWDYYKNLGGDRLLVALEAAAAMSEDEANRLIEMVIHWAQKLPKPEDSKVREAWKKVTRSKQADSIWEGVRKMLQERYAYNSADIGKMGLQSAITAMFNQPPLVGLIPPPEVKDILGSDLTNKKDFKRGAGVPLPSHNMEEKLANKVIENFIAAIREAVHSGREEKDEQGAVIGRFSDIHVTEIPSVTDPAWQRMREVFSQQPYNLDTLRAIINLDQDDGHGQHVTFADLLPENGNLKAKASIIQRYLTQILDQQKLNLGEGPIEAETALEKASEEAKRQAAQRQRKETQQEFLKQYKANADREREKTVGIPFSPGNQLTFKNFEETAKKLSSSVKNITREIASSIVTEIARIGGFNPEDLRALEEKLIEQKYKKSSIVTAYKEMVKDNPNLSENIKKFELQKHLQFGKGYLSQQRAGGALFSEYTCEKNKGSNVEFTARLYVGEASQGKSRVYFDYDSTRHLFILHNPEGIFTEDETLKSSQTNTARALRAWAVFLQESGEPKAHINELINSDCRIIIKAYMALRLTGLEVQDDHDLMQKKISVGDYIQRERKFEKLYAKHLSKGTLTDEDKQKELTLKEIAEIKLEKYSLPPPRLISRETVPPPRLVHAH